MVVKVTHILSFVIYESIVETRAKRRVSGSLLVTFFGLAYDDPDHIQAVGVQPRSGTLICYSRQEGNNNQTRALLKVDSG